MKCVPDIVYEPEQKLALDLYLPDNLTARACVIYAHGGDFTFGARDAQEVPYFAAALVDAGFAMASVTYRLKPKAELFDEIDRDRIEAYKARSAKIGLSLSSKLYGHRFIAAMEDISRAIEFLWVEGGRLGIQHRKTGLLGTSAGGIASLGLAYPPTHWSHKTSKPDAVVAIGSAIVQPWRLTDEGPPCLLIHDTADDVIAVSNPQLGVSRAEVASAPIALMEVSLGAHKTLADLVLDGADENGVPYMQSVIDQFARLVDD